MKRFLQTMSLVLLLLMSVACEETAIVHDLNERDANEVIVLLARNNIKATKQKEERNQEIFWKIAVSADDNTRARSILVANNLPRIRQGGLKGICEDTSMIVTEETEKCRKLLAYKGEIINSLESVPGVVSADVVLNIPDKVEFPDENTPIARPTAAVTVKYLTDANVKTKLTEGKIQDFVANSISGLDARDVAVIISYLEQKIDEPTQKDNNKDSEPVVLGQQENSDGTPTASLDENDDPLVSVAGIMMDERSAKKFKIIAALFLVLLLFLSAAFIFALFRMSKLRKQSSVEAEVEDDSQEMADKKLLEA